MAESDKIGEVRLPIRASLVSALAVVILCAVYWYFTRDAAKTVLFLAAGAAGAGAILSAFFSARALDHTVQELEKQQVDAKRAVALSVVSRWNDAKMFHVRDTVREVMRTEKESEEYNRIISEKETNVTHFLNFLEEIAIAIECEAADPDVLRCAFKGVIVRSWITFAPFAAKVRADRRSDAIWERVEGLAKEWGK